MKRDRGYQREWGRICADCGYARINVRHNVTAESQVEGPDYYAPMPDLHEFVPTDRFTSPHAATLHARPVPR